MQKSAANKMSDFHKKQAKTHILQELVSTKHGKFEKKRVTDDVSDDNPVDRKKCKRIKPKQSMQCY